MGKKTGIVICLLCVVAIGLSVAALAVAVPMLNAQSQQTTNETPKDTQFVLYLGTNDKDTNLPVFGSAEAKEQLKAILLDKFGGYTIQEANGGWKDGETVYQEYTLVIYLSDTTIADVHDAADRMIEVFHQSSVLIQSNQTITEFYSGKK
ncbi:MAG: hypothetical protein IJ735_05240 [Clostridia bacterium]|nr:hypothetical protein [Clostridia bacterium]